MRNPISTAPKYADFSGFDDIAKRLVEAYKDTFAGIKPRSLAIHIGELDRGKVTWWVSRPDKTQCLAEFLEIDQEELGVNENAGRHTFSLPGFKDCPPLDLMREDIWKIGEPRLVSNLNESQGSRYDVKPTLDIWRFAESASSRSGEVEWLHVPDNVEYQLLTRKLSAVSRDGIVERRSLQEVLQRDIAQVCQKQALIVVVENGARREDLQDLADYRRGAAALVISLCPPPAPAPQWQTAASDDEPKGPGSHGSARINHWTWNLLPKWREDLLQWVGQRNAKLGFDDTRYTKDLAIGLLKSLDPGRRWFMNVSDLLTLCQAVSESGKQRLLDDAGSDGDIEKLLSRLFGPDDSVRDRVLHLVKARWDRWDLPWAGEMSQDYWIELSKDLCSLGTLLAQKVIVRGKEGYDFQQPILSRLLLRHELMSRLLKGELASWAPACFDSERRPLLDATLDALTISELRLVTTKIQRRGGAQITGAEPESAEIVGVREALFTAIGRRLIRCPDERMPDDLMELAAAAINRMRWQDGLLVPLSRLLDAPGERLEWITVCWAWSLQQAPKIDILPHWMFPGWAKDLSQTVPGWLSHCGNLHYGDPWERSPQQMDDFLRVVMRWLNSRGKVIDVANKSIVFNIALLACASPDGQPASKYWWAGVFGTPSAEQALLNIVESRDEAAKRSTALAWWPSLIEVRREECKSGGSASVSWGTSPLSLGGYRGSSVINWVLKHVAKSSAQAIQVLDDDEIVFLAAHPRDLPTSLKKKLLSEFLIRNLPSKLHVFETPRFFLNFGAEPQLADEVEAYLAFPDTLGLSAAQYLWSWASDAAERLLAQKSPPTKEALRNLLFCSPYSAVPKVIGLLREDPGLLPDDKRVEWVYDRLPDARQHAQALMQLI